MKVLDEELYPERDVAKHLHLSQKTIQRIRKAGKIEAICTSARHVLYTGKAIKKFLRENRTRP